MPDNKLFKNKNTLEERAWADMLKRLDSSMPVTRASGSRERMLLIIMLFVIAAMGAYIAHLRTQNPDQTKPLPAEKELFAEKGINEKAKAYTLENDQQNDQKKNGEVQNQTNNSGKNVSQFNSPQFAQIGKINDKQTNYQAVYDQKNSGDPKHNSLNENKDIVPDQIDPVKNKTDLALALKDIQENMFQESVIPSITSINSKINLIEIPSLLPEMPENNAWLFAGKESICKHSFAISSGVISENISSFGGLDMGITYDHALSRKWTFQSGLKFQMFNKAGFSNSLALSSIINAGKPWLINTPDEDWAEYRYLYNVENSEIINNEIGVEYITGIVDQLYYLTVPVNLTFTYKKSRFIGGTNLSLLLRGTNKIRDYSDTYFNTVVLSNNVFEKRNYFNRLDVSLNLGYELSIWKDLKLYASYNHGLFNIIRSGSGKQNNASFKDVYETIYESNLDRRIDYNRYFTLGLTYALDNCK